MLLWATQAFAQPYDSDFVRIPEEQKEDYQATPMLKSAEVPSGSIQVAENAEYNTYSPQQLVENILVSGCLKASNVKFGYYTKSYTTWNWSDHYWSSTAGNRQLGYFHKGNSDFPLEEGLLLSTGKISSAEGPNNLASKTDEMVESARDKDLEDLAGHTSYDAAILEFDFVPAGNTMEFRYVFASEEYREWACSQYNDAFGFFLSGPGISGSVNLAKLSNGTAVTINNIHGPFTSTDASYYSYNERGPYPCSAQNDAYYIDNGSGKSYTSAENSPTTQFDGMTVVLTATYEVQACETYHIKLAIADVSDQKWDAGVFLEARSFNSDRAGIYNIGGGMVNNLNIFESDNVNCENALVVKRKDSDNSADITFPLILEGSFSNGNDIVTLPGGNPFPNSVTIPAGQDSVIIPYKAVNDGTSDNLETFTVKIAISCPCDATTEYESVTMTIHDPISIDDVGIANVRCDDPNSGSIEISASGGTGNFLYSIDGTNFQSSNIFANLAADNYTVYVREADGLNCDNDVTEPLTINAATPISASALITEEIDCFGGTAKVFINASGGVEPFTYTFNGISNNTGEFTNIIAGNYSWSVTDTFGCGPESGTLDVTEPTELNVVAESNSPVCEGGNLHLYETGGEAISWSWTGPNGFTSTEQNPTILGATSVYDGLYTVTASDGTCFSSASVDVSVSSDPIAVTNCPTDIIECADMIYDGKLGKIINWSIPDFNLNCLGSGSNSNFNMQFELNENLLGKDCWDFNYVTRAGGSGGFMKLFNSNKDSIHPTLITPYVYIEANIPASIDIIYTDGDYDIQLYLVDVDGNDLPMAGSHFVTAAQTTYTFTTNNNESGIYRLKFVVHQNSGDTGSNANSLDNISFDGVIFDDGCTGGIDFVVSGPVPGFFPVVNDSLITYTAVYTPSSGTPASAICQFNVTIEGLEASITDFADATCGDDNGYITIAVETSSPAPELEFSLNSGSWTPFGAGNTSTTIDGLAAGSYSIMVKDVSLVGDCQILDPLNATISAIPGPTVTLSDVGPFCEDAEPVSLDGSPSGGVYSGPGVDASGLFTPGTASIGNNTIKYVYTDENECKDSSEIIIVINALPTVSITPAGPFCTTGEAYQLTGNPEGGTFSGTGVSETGLFDPAATGAGSYSISYTYTDRGIGCTNTAQTTIEVEVCCSLESAEANVTDGIVCYGETATVEITAVGGIGPLTYTLDSYENQTGIFTNIPAGTYTWSVSESGDCDPITGNITVTGPETELSCETSLDNVVTCVGGTDGEATVTPTGGWGGYSYLWSDGQTSATA
ncbi:hypothetical protein D1164_21635, partial [Mariniphaga sediminis]